MGGSRPGPVQRGPSLGCDGQRDPWGQHSPCQWERWFLKARGRVVQSCGDGVGTPPAAPLPAPPPAWLFPEGPVPTCWPPLHSPSAPLSGPRSRACKPSGCGSLCTCTSGSGEHLRWPKTACSTSLPPGHARPGRERGRFPGEGARGLPLPHPFLGRPGLCLIPRG